MDELQKAKQAIWKTSDSVQQIGLIENAIRIADSLGEEEEAFSLRDDLISTCTEYGQFMKALVAFSWCLAKVDEAPDKYPFDYNTIWNYQALLYRAAAFDLVSLDKLYDLLNDFHRRMKEIGASERNIHESRIRVGLVLRDKEMVLAARDNMKKHRQDSHCDCKACVQNTLMQTELYFGTYEKAMELAQPLIDGKMSCNMVPLRTFGFMINYVHRAGDSELAQQIYKKGIRLIGKKGGFLEQIGNYLIYLSSADPVEGLRVFQRSLPWALNETEMPWSIFHFHMGTHALFTNLQAGKPCGKLMLDPKYSLYMPEGTYQYALLADHHGKEAAAFAARFDKRNRSTVASDIFVRAKALLNG